MFYLLFLAILVLDYVTKWYVKTHFFLGESIPVIPGVFHWTYIVNYGAAFGILKDQRWIFLGVVLLLLAIFFYYRQKLAQTPSWVRAGVAMLLAGAVGNAFDRFVYGGVVDFFDFRVWPIFNVADIGICIGVAIVAYYLVRKN